MSDSDVQTLVKQECAKGYHIFPGEHRDYENGKNRDAQCVFCGETIGKHDGDIFAEVVAELKRKYGG